MNILLINGSPKGKRSNSLRLANRFIEGFKEGYKSKNEAIISIDEMHVASMNVGACKGCCMLAEDTGGVLHKYLKIVYCGGDQRIHIEFPRPHRTPGGTAHRLVRRAPAVRQRGGRAASSMMRNTMTEHAAGTDDAAPYKSSLPQVLDALNLSPGAVIRGATVFTGAQFDAPFHHILGGHIAAQALVAAGAHRRARADAAQPARLLPARR